MQRGLGVTGATGSSWLSGCYEGLGIAGCSLGLSWLMAKQDELPLGRYTSHPLCAAGSPPSTRHKILQTCAGSSHKNITALLWYTCKCKLDTETERPRPNSTRVDLLGVGESQQTKRRNITGDAVQHLGLKHLVEHRHHHPSVGKPCSRGLSPSESQRAKPAADQTATRMRA